MGMTTIRSETSDAGVTERLFDVTVEEERIPAVLWTPQGAPGPRPLMLMGHGASQHKKTESLAARARHYALRHGWATLSIDAMGHGERITPDEAEVMARDVVARVRGAGEKSGPSPIFKTMKERARRIVPEWRAALDAAQALDAVGAGRPIGYWGLSMGAVLGVPFVAAEPRVTCAVFGLAGVRAKDEAFLAAARSITIPVQFTFQWDDAIASRETGLALFDALGSAEKTMHVNPGGHGAIPSFENAAWEAFFLRHLGR
jgi:dienelactone hydrolase